MADLTTYLSLSQTHTLVLQQAKKMAKLLKSKKAQYQRESHCKLRSDNCIHVYLMHYSFPPLIEASSGSGVLELSVLQGRNLVAKDTNGEFILGFSQSTAALVLL